jgi:hypothetical protein
METPDDCFVDESGLPNPRVGVGRFRDELCRRADGNLSNRERCQHLVSTLDEKARQRVLFAFN